MHRRKPFYLENMELYNLAYFESNNFSHIPSPQPTAQPSPAHDSEETEPDNVVYSVATSSTPLTTVDATMKKAIADKVEKIKATEVQEHENLAQKIEAMWCEPWQICKLTHAEELNWNWWKPQYTDGGTP